MKPTQLSLSLLLLAGVMAYTPIVALAQGAPVKGVKPGVIGAIALSRSGTFCHLRFPAIRPSTLTSNKPELKSADSGDIIDYYGPCDHDPLGADEVAYQKKRDNLRRTGRP
jgi:hypothetical protein